MGWRTHPGWLRLGPTSVRLECAGVGRTLYPLFLQRLIIRNKLHKNQCTKIKVDISEESLSLGAIRLEVCFRRLRQPGSTSCQNISLQPLMKGSWRRFKRRRSPARRICSILIAQHPELLDGEQITPGDARRWILITREKGIAELSGQAARWSVDHLIVDQDAVPTLAELKRGSNPEIRRAIVGQLLEYAAHAAETWTAEERPPLGARILEAAPRTGRCARWPSTVGCGKVPCSAGSICSAFNRTDNRRSSCPPTRLSSRRFATCRPSPQPAPITQLNRPDFAGGSLSCSRAYRIVRRQSRSALGISGCFSRPERPVACNPRAR